MATRRNDEQRLLAAFEESNYAEAVSLLPLVREPKKLFSYDYRDYSNCSYGYGCFKIGLLHLAAKKGWLDVMKDLVDNYNFEPTNKEHCNAYTLCVAVENNHIDVVKYLITQCGCDPNVANKMGITFLHVAVEMNHIDLVKYFINQCGCSPNVADGMGRTCLHAAVEVNHIDLVKYFINQCGCDPTVVDGLGRTYLHVAVEMNHIDMVKYLINQCGCDPKVGLGRTYLQIAVEKNHIDLVKYLINQCGCDPKVTDSLGRTYLHIAVERNHIDLVKYLINQYGCDPKVTDSLGRTYLHIAVERNHIDLVKYLINQCGFDAKVTDSWGRTYLHVAIERNHIDLVKYLINQYGCDPKVTDSLGRTYLHIAVEKNHIDLVKYFVNQYGCDPKVTDSLGRTYLHIAVEKNHIDLVKYLINQCGCDPNVVNGMGRTCLHVAIENNHIDIVKYLIMQCHCDPNTDTELCRKCLDIAMSLIDLNFLKYLVNHCGCNNVVDRMGRTYLHVVIERSDYHIDLVKYLINLCGCDPNVVDGMGRTCLHVAVEMNHIDMVKYLINQCGCDPKVGLGRTYLHIAVEKNHVDLVKYLINLCGCDPNVVDGMGRTCLHVAVEKNHIDIVKYLIMQCHCDPNTDTELCRKCLDIAMSPIDLDFLKYLVNQCGCNPNVVDGMGRTYLHVAIERNHVDLVKYLINQCGWDAKATDALGRTYLHIAVERNHIDLVKYLINQCGCDPNVADGMGRTCLHVAVEKNHIDIVKYLIMQCHCDPNTVTELCRKCLDIAMSPIDLDFLKYLINQCGCDPNVADGMGRTCLHVAVEKNHIDIVKYLIMQCHCDPNTVTELCRKCLDIAMSPIDLDFLKYLINLCGCDPNVADGMGRTCLHVAVKKCNLFVIEYLLSTGKINPSDIKTSLMLANGNEAILSLFTKFGNIKTSHPVDSYVNVLLLGNPGAGKSTLTKVIFETANGAFTFGQFRNVNGVKLYTAGIIPTKLEHKELGNTILHDFAGHSEYYSSHTAVIENLLQGSGAAFVIVVDITNEESSKHLQQWLTVVNNEVHKCISQSQCHVAVAVSHIDKMNNAITMSKRLEELSEIISVRCDPGMIPLKLLDCRKLGGSNLTSLINELSSSCQSIRSTSGKNLSLYCHMMYAFLEDSKLNILSLLDIVYSPLKHQYALPEKVEEIYEILHSLSSTGLICLVKSHEDESKVWVVINKQILLAEVNGILFAPKSFKQHCSVASNSGIITLSSLINLFPHYDPDMIISFLTNMALCQEISPQFLTMTNLKALIDDDKLLFFPTLLQIDRPNNITGQEFKFGWCLKCTESYHFFPPRFFHIVMLHLAYKYGLPKDSGHLPINIISRHCTFWRNGIHWFDGNGVETLVEIVDESQCALVLMSCEVGYEQNMISLRKHVITELVDVKIQSFQSLKTSEFVIDPKELIYPINKLRHKTLFDVSNILKFIRDKRDFIIYESHLRENETLQQRSIRELLTNEEITDITQLSIVGKHHLTPEELTKKGDKPQLCDLMNILATIAHQYKLIGTALKVPDLGLHPLPRYYKENLEQTLQWWLNNGDSVGSPVTWDNIINAIGGPIVENYHIAEEMRQFHNQLKNGAD